MKPVSDDIGISTWEICSDESRGVWRERVAKGNSRNEAGNSNVDFTN